MTHVDDLYEPNDRGPEPDVEHPEPVNLDEVAGLLQKAENATVRDEQEEAERELIEKAVPQMIDEIGDLRLRIAEFEALPVREVWALSSDQNTPPEEDAYIFRNERNAFGYAERDGRTVWRRTVPLRPWEPISGEAPF